MNPKVDVIIAKAKKWKPEIEMLREIILGCGLTEELKWYQPVYTFNDTNIIIIGSFKDFCCISFFKGVLLKDTKGILTQAGENTQSARIIKFTDVKEITKNKATIKAYIKEAIEIEKAGLKVSFKKITEHKIPVELEDKFKEDAKFEEAFKALTSGRQRGYLLHFSSAKQVATRISRIEKAMTAIYEGKGFNE